MRNCFLLLLLDSRRLAIGGCWNTKQGARAGKPGTVRGREPSAPRAGAKSENGNENEDEDEDENMDMDI